MAVIEEGLVFNVDTKGNAFGRLENLRKTLLEVKKNKNITITANSTGNAMSSLTKLEKLIKRVEREREIKLKATINKEDLREITKPKELEFKINKIKLRQQIQSALLNPFSLPLIPSRLGVTPVVPGFGGRTPNIPSVVPPAPPIPPPTQRLGFFNRLFSGGAGIKGLLAQGGKIAGGLLLSGLKKGGDLVAKGIKNTFDKAIRGLKIAGGLLLAKGIRDIIRARPEQTASMFSTVYGRLTPEALRESQRISNITGRGQWSTRRDIANVGDIAMGYGANRQESLKMAKAIKELSINLGSYVGVSDERAMNALVSATLGKMPRAAKSLNVNLTQQQIFDTLKNQSEAMTKAYEKFFGQDLPQIAKKSELAKIGTVDYSKIAIASAYVQSGGAKAHGGAGMAFKDTFSGAIEQLKGQWNDLIMDISIPVQAFFAPIIGNIASAVRGINREQLMEKLADGFTFAKIQGRKLKPVIKAVGDVFEFISPILVKVIDVGTTFLGGIGSIISYVIEKVNAFNEWISGLNVKNDENYYTKDGLIYKREVDAVAGTPPTPDVQNKYLGKVMNDNADEYAKTREEFKKSLKNIEDIMSSTDRGMAENLDYNRQTAENTKQLTKILYVGRGQELQLRGSERIVTDFSGRNTSVKFGRAVRDKLKKM